MKKLILLFCFSLCATAFSSRQEEIQALPVHTYPTAAAWERIGLKEHFGIDFHLLSIHSEASSGNGEFYDLFPIIDWLEENKMDILQFLPLNDTGNLSSPYSPVSLNALHPIYLSLSSLPFLSSAPQQLLDELHGLKSFNHTKRVLYNTVLEKKLEWLRHYIDIFQNHLTAQTSYKNFLVQSADWISDYALFKVLQDQYGDSWQKWPKELSHPSKKVRNQLKKEYAKDVTFYMILQHLCFQQMERVKNYANAHHVFIKGDVPFLVGINCVDVWLAPNLFKIDSSIGTPANLLYPNGQYWGLPPYNWDAIEKEHYQSIKNRLKTCGLIYDLFRIDYCKGYFTQYEIPADQPPTTGHQVPSDEAEAIKEGKRHLLAMVTSTNMLPIAEDVGMTPAMKAVLAEMGIPGIHLFVLENLKLPPQDQMVSGKNYGLLSVSQLSNHDLPPLRLFWIENPKRAQNIATKLGWKYSQRLTVFQQQMLLWMNMHTSSLFHIEMLQDLLPPNLSHATEDQQINYPGTVSKHNWTYRYKLSASELAKNPELQAMVNAAMAPTPPQVPLSLSKDLSTPFQRLQQKVLPKDSGALLCSETP